MSLVIRINGNEPYVKIKIKQKYTDEMEKAGHFSNYNAEFGYVEGDYAFSSFEYKGVRFKLEYFDGCFYPFLLQLK